MGVDAAGARPQRSRSMRRRGVVPVRSRRNRSAEYGRRWTGDRRAGREHGAAVRSLRRERRAESIGAPRRRATSAFRTCREITAMLICMSGMRTLLLLGQGICPIKKGSRETTVVRRLLRFLAPCLQIRVARFLPRVDPTTGRALLPARIGISSARRLLLPPAGVSIPGAPPSKRQRGETPASAASVGVAARIFPKRRSRGSRPEDATALRQERISLGGTTSSSGRPVSEEERDGRTRSGRRAIASGDAPLAGSPTRDSDGSSARGMERIACERRPTGCEPDPVGVGRPPADRGRATPHPGGAYDRATVPPASGVGRGGGRRCHEANATRTSLPRDGPDATTPPRSVGGGAGGIST